MSALAISLVVWAILVGGALTGAGLRHRLPNHHLDTHAKDIVRLGAALIATISGLVLGLLINSAKSNFDTQRDEIRQLTANTTLLDHVLDEYGPEAKQARANLRKAVDAAIDRIWSEGATKTKPGAPFTATTAGEATERAIGTLKPETDMQRLLQSQAIQIMRSILQMRLILHEQSGVQPPIPFLVVLVFWLFILFASFSLFSPLNPTALGAIVVIALSASGAIFLILEMSEPFTGLMRIDSEPVRHALAALNT
jgi:Protein of unknown function (DUF4239)